MENDVRSVTKEMENYFSQITKDVNDNASLTSIQNKKHQEKIIEKYKAKGITYFISEDNENSNHSRICFQSLPWSINDVGSIIDVFENGAFPLLIYIEDNISVKYEPRKLNEKNYLGWQYIKNKKFIHIKKGSEYRFKGRITFCDYYYNVKPKGRFEFHIINRGLTNEHCFIATVYYGSYDAPEVLVLRKFRDDKLLTTLIGKIFVTFYYTFSPLVAKIISKSNIVKKFIGKCIIEPLVTEISEQKTIIKK